MNKHITEREFDLIISKSNFLFERFPHIGICFSGGSDSLALLLLMKNWIKKHKGNLTILYFDHKLRKESIDELIFAKKLAKKFKFNFRSFEWNSIKPTKSIMERAREIRYERIIEFCKKKKIISLMTAHHLDDSLETYVMRKQRKFSTLGLSSIPGNHFKKNLQIVRPLIGIEKNRLALTCIFNDFGWIEDISNLNLKFERVRIREKIKLLDEKSKTILKKDLQDSKKKNQEIEKKIALFFLENLNFENFGKFLIKKKKFLNCKVCLQIEILKKILVTCSGSTYPPRVNSIKKIVEKLEYSKTSKFTLHSCIINVMRDKIEFYREYKKTRELMKKRIVIKKSAIFFWDHRYIIKSKFSDLTCYIFDDKMWVKLRKDFKSLKDYKQIDYDILKTLPILKINKKYLIPFVSSYDDLKEQGVEVIFEPKISLTKKNF